MYKRCYMRGAVAVLAAIGATGAFAAGNTGGIIRFTGRVFQPGYSMLATPRVASAAGGLQTQADASGDQVVVDFSTQAQRPVPAMVSVAVRTESLARWQRVGEAGSAAGMRVRYGGFNANVLAGNNGTLTLSRPLGAEPALAVVSVAYR